MNTTPNIITYEIQRFPMISDGQGGFTLYNRTDHNGQKWEFMDVSVTKRVDDCLVDEVASVDNIKNIREADRALQAFESAFPNADVTDHLEGLADYGIPEQQDKGGIKFTACFGPEAVELFEEAKGEDVPNEAFSEEDFEGIVKRMVFATNAEAAAYQKGVMDMDGWTEYGFYDCK